MTVNPCRLCAPLGAVLAFKGFAGMMPILHGSQGCATYIRRYLISHFREPVDVASSSFTEETAIFGGQAQLTTALRNVAERYRPLAVGIASTCLSETIGDDVGLFIRELETEGIPLVSVSTPSYSGCHADGFKETVAQVLRRFLATGISGSKATESDPLLLLPGMVSPADLRHLKELVSAFGLRPITAPDYSDTLDGGSWEVYHPLAPGGTATGDLEVLTHGTPWLGMSGAAIPNQASCAAEERLGRSGFTRSYPMGIEATDALIESLKLIADRPVPAWIEAERSRLLDSYADFHKYLAGVRAAVVADADLADGTVRLLEELGVSIAFAATPDVSTPLEDREFPAVGGIDYDEVDGLIDQYQPDLIIGSSKLYPSVRGRELPLIRIGFPVHDRVGGPRLLHLGYRGSQQLLDRIVNAILKQRQAQSKIGYAYQ